MGDRRRSSRARLDAYHDGRRRPGNIDLWKDGGGDCAACADGRACKAASDCTSASCVMSACKAAACTDGVKNGGEVDVDCGGPCGPCSAGKACAVAKDCLSGRCEMMKCVALDLAFAAPAAYVTGTGPFTLVTGDWNGDGKPDVATLNQSQFSISVLVNAGKPNGQLLPATNYNVAYQPRALVTGDFNGDMKPDLMSVPSSGIPTVLAGKGDGTFTPVVQQVQVPGFATTAAAGDFDGDGKLDVALLYATQYVQFLLGTGNGTFTLNGNTQPAQGAQSLSVADWNGDGRADFAVAQSYLDLNNVQQHRVTFFLGKALQPGKLDFTQFTYITLPGMPAAILGAEVSGDKRSDLFIAYGAGVGNVGLALGEARNQNVPSLLQPLPLIGGARLLYAGDYNGDGKVDLIAASAAQNAWVAWSGNGDGTFAMPPTFASTPSPPGAAAVVDLAGDNKPEICAIVGSTLAVYPEGGLLPAVVYDPANAQARAPALADLNHDNKLDLVVAGTKGLSVALGKGDGTFQPPAVTPTVSQAQSVVLRDVNADQHADAIVGSGTGNMIFVHLGVGDGTFQAPLQLMAGNLPAGVAVGDLNGDGALDIATANANSNDVTVLWNSNGIGMGGLFGMSTTLALGMGSPSSLTIADATGDGNPDLVVPLPAGTNVAILAGNGKGSFAMPVNLAVGQRPVAVVTGDLNGDGRLDIATANLIGNSTSVLLGSPNGMFLAAVSYPTGINPTSIAVADFNLDGRPDLAVGNSASHSASVLLGDGAGVFQPALSYLTGMQPQLAAGDLNGDGKADLVTANSNLGNVSVVLNLSQ